MNARLDRFMDLAAAHLLGALEAKESLEFEALLAEADEEMQRAFNELEHTALHIPLSAPPAKPPPAVKEAIMASVRGEKITGAPIESLWIVRWLGLHRPRSAAAAILVLTVLLAGAGIVATLLWSSLARSERRIVELEGELQRNEQLLAVLHAKQVEIVRLDGLEINPRGYGKIIWDTESGVAVLQVSNLPPAPAGKAYQLWVYPKEGEPASAGVFAVRDPQRDAFFRLENFTAFDRQAIKGLVISLEPAGGAVRPGENWYLGGKYHSGNQEN